MDQCNTGIEEILFQFWFTNVKYLGVLFFELNFMSRGFIILRVKKKIFSKYSMHNQKINVFKIRWFQQKLSQQYFTAFYTILYHFAIFKGYTYCTHVLDYIQKIIQIYTRPMSLTLSDPQVFELTKYLYTKMDKYEQINSLKTDQIQEVQLNEIFPLHPHQIMKDSDGNQKPRKYSCWQIFCNLKVGRYFCWSNEKSDGAHKDLGLAMCLYFKSLKHLLLIFLVIGLLSAISVSLCYMVASKNDVDVTKGYKQLLFSSSIGVLFLQEIQCHYYLSGQVPVLQANFSLTCAVGHVSKLGPVYTTNTFETITNCNNQLNKIQDDSEQALASSSYDQLFTDCVSNSTSCTVNIIINSPSNSYKYLSYVYQCKGAVYPVGAINFTKKQITYVIIGIDLFCVFLLMLFIWSQSKAEDKQVDQFKDQQFTLSDYSVQIKHVHTENAHNETYQLFQEIKQLCLKKDVPSHSQEDIIGSQGDRLDSQGDRIIQNDILSDLVQVKLPDAYHYRQIDRIKIKYSQNVYEIIKETFFNNKLSPYSAVDFADFMSTQFKSPQEYLFYRQKLTKSIQNYLKKTQFSKVQKNTNKSPIVLTFQHIDSIQKLKLLRKKKCFGKYLSVKQGQQIVDYRVRQAPIPDLILWENRYKHKHVRRFFSWVITFLIVFGSLLLIGYVISRQNQLLKKYNFNVDCQSAFPSQLFDSYDSTRLSNPFYLHCFCSSHAVLSNIVDQQFQGQCSQWSTQYSWYLAIPALFSFMIVVYNVIISYIFLWLSIFQAHSLLNTQMTSYIIKRSVVLILNMGVILIFLNFDYGFKGEFLQNYQGTYKDFAGDWYLEIGIIIILTIIFNVGFPILQLMIYSLLYCFKTIWDKRCFTRKTSLKYKYEYVQMYGGFTYPIQERYATILAVFFISLALNGVLPLINIIIFLFVSFLILTDRFLVFKLFRKLKNYQDTLHRNMMKVFYLFLMVHLVITAFLFTEPFLLVGQERSLLGIQNKRISAIFNTPYIVPYPIILFLMIIFVIMMYLCNVLNKIFQFLSRRKGANSQNKKQYKSFYQALNGYQIKQLLIVSQYQSQKQQEIISKIKIQQFDLQKNSVQSNQFNQLNQLKRTQNAHNQLEEIQKRKIDKLKRRKNLKSSTSQGPRLIGPACYQKQCDQKVVQAQIQTIALDKVCKKIAKRRLQGGAKQPDIAYQYTTLALTQGSEVQRLNNILEILQQNRKADIKITQPYFNEKKSDQKISKNNIKDQSANQIKQSNNEAEL